MDQQTADTFARDWIAAWNDHDLEAVLAHYSDDIVFHSPRIAAVMGGVSSLVSGKDALEAYWLRALAQAPKLYFELDRILIGSDALTLIYTNHRDQMTAETFVFGTDGKVIEAYATYALA